MLRSFKDLDCNMSTKVHYLRGDLDHFSKNLADLKKQDGRFYQDIRVMEERYQGIWDVTMLAFAKTLS